MAAVFHGLKQLYDCELFEDVCHLGSMMLTICDRSPDFLTPYLRYQCLVFVGDALFQLRQYRRAEQTYMKALHVRKSATNKGTEAKKFAIIIGPAAEVNVKFQLYKCLCELRRYHEALGVLESIPAKMRTPKVHVALSRMYKQVGTDTARSRSDAWREVLKECPYSLSAMLELLNTGTSVDDLQSIGDLHMIATQPHMEWFMSWMNAHGALVKQDCNQAIALFQDLDSTSEVSQNATILHDLGFTYYAAGDYNRAITSFQRISSVDPLFLKGMDILSYLYLESKQYRELESLANKLMTVEVAVHARPLLSEPWVAMGYACKALRKSQRALYFAHEACNIGVQPSVEALLLKGRCLLDTRKFQEAAQHFLEALRLNSTRYETYEALVELNMQREKINEARLYALTCVKQLGQRARPLALLAKIYAKDPGTLTKAQRLLETSVEASPHYLHAAFELMKIYDQQKQYDKAIELLTKLAEVHVSSKIHKLLGDFLVKTKQLDEAFDRYRNALTIDPNDVDSKLAMADLERDFLFNDQNFQDSPYAASTSANSTICPPPAPRVNRTARHHGITISSSVSIERTPEPPDFDASTEDHNV